MENEINAWLSDIKQAIYDSVSEDIIWAIIIRYLPKLEEEIDALLR